MDSTALAHIARDLRRKEGFTQRSLAEHLVEKKLFESLSQEMIRRAEDSSISTGSKLLELRVAIIQELEGRKIRGPIWVYEDEVGGEA